jgi:hypothetical protein
MAITFSAISRLIFFSFFTLLDHTRCIFHTAVMRLPFLMMIGVFVVLISSVTAQPSACNAGQYLISSYPWCQDCEAGTVCPDGVNSGLCPYQTTSPPRATSESECVPITLAPSPPPYSFPTPHTSDTPSNISSSTGINSSSSSSTGISGNSSSSSSSTAPSSNGAVTTPSTVTNVSHHSSSDKTTIASLAVACALLAILMVAIAAIMCYRWKVCKKTTAYAPQSDVAMTAVGQTDASSMHLHYGVRKA